MNYYGMDWVAMVASVVALLVLGNKNRTGFLFFLIANIAWIVFGHIAGRPAIVIGNLIFAVCNMTSWLQWNSAFS